MMKLLTTFAALSIVGTVILSLLPEGTVKRTAGMAIGLISLMCWAEGVAALLDIDLTTELPATVFAPTSVSIRTTAEDAAASLAARWEAAP